MQDDAVFGCYKPLRNHIRKLCLADSLGVIRAYQEHLQCRTPIPQDCEVEPAFASAEKKIDKVKWISEWELETLCREVILHAQDMPRCPETLRSWKTLAQIINKLKSLEEFIAGRFESREAVMLELHRVAHRQFPWQMSRLDAGNIMRYFLLYKHPALEQIVRRVIGLSVEELFLMGMALLGLFTTNIALHCPPNIQIPGLSVDTLDRFRAHFSIDLSSLKRRLKEEQQMNDRFAYAYHSLRAFPLIRMIYKERDSLACPLPTLLFWRFTAGVYYEICKEDGFDNAFGDAFQVYVGKVLERAVTPEKTRVYGEEEYRVGRDLKRTVDWIVDQDNAALFIEAKTKRMVMEARVEIVDPAVLSSELTKMADMIVQVYKSIKDYRDNLYPTYRFKNDRTIFPLIVTLEDWFLFGERLLSELAGKVLEAFRAEHVPEEWLREMPYTVCSVHELERAIQVMDSRGIKAVMEGKTCPEKREWAIEPYLQNDYKAEMRATRFLFPEEFDRLDVSALGEAGGGGPVTGPVSG